MAIHASMGTPSWRWAVEDEPPHEGSEEELIRQLASGRLPPFTLVWREGWGEWLPAMQVAELAGAFPEGSIGTRPARASLIPGVPPVPVSEYPRLRHLAKAAPLGWPDGFEGHDQEVITSEVPAVALIEAARAMTKPIPPRDLGLQQALQIERTSRLSLIPHPALVQRPSVPPRASLLPPAPRPSHTPPPVAVQSSAAVQSPLAPHLPDWRDDDRTPQSTPALPLAAELGLARLLEQEPPRRSAVALRSRWGLWIAIAALALGLGATFALRWLGTRRHGPPAAAASAAMLRQSAVAARLAPGAPRAVQPAAPAP